MHEQAHEQCYGSTVADSAFSLSKVRNMVVSCVNSVSRAITLFEWYPSTAQEEPDHFEISKANISI